MLVLAPPHPPVAAFGPTACAVAMTATRLPTPPRVVCTTRTPTAPLRLGVGVGVGVGVGLGVEVVLGGRHKRSSRAGTCMPPLLVVLPVVLPRLTVALRTTQVPVVHLPRSAQPNRLHTQAAGVVVVVHTVVVRTAVVVVRTAVVVVHTAVVAVVHMVVVVVVVAVVHMVVAVVVVGRTRMQVDAALGCEPADRAP